MKLNPFRYYNKGNIHELEEFLDKRCKEILTYLEPNFNFEDYGTTDITKVIKNKIFEKMLFTEIDIRLYEEVDYIEDLFFSIALLDNNDPHWSLCVTYFCGSYVDLKDLDNYTYTYSPKKVKEADKNIRVRRQELIEKEMRC